MAKVVQGCILTGWLVCLGVGFYKLWLFEITPASPSSASDLQLQKTNMAGIARANLALPLLVLFVHPLCPCSQATISELHRLRSKHPRNFELQVFFYQPLQKDPAFVTTDLFEKANRIEGLRIHQDPDGKTARSMGVKTSGEALFFDRNFNMIFHGGITSSRGHEGDNLGSASIEEFLISGKTLTNETPVYGCPL